MSACSCNYKWSCVLTAMIASVIIGVIAAFLQITGIVTVTAAFLWVLLGIGVGFLGILVLSSALLVRTCVCAERCCILTAVLAGILGTILFAVVLLAVGVTATSVISAILVGLLLFFASLTVTALACYVRCSVNCTD